MNTISGQGLDMSNGATLATTRSSESVDLVHSTANQMESAIQRDDPVGMLESARELEGVFISMIFNEMGKMVEKEDGLFPSTPGSEMFEQWFRTEVGNQWARAGGTGLGDTIAESMGMDSQRLEEANHELVRRQVNRAYQQNR